LQTGKISRSYTTESVKVVFLPPKEVVQIFQGGQVSIHDRFMIIEDVISLNDHVVINSQRYEIHNIEALPENIGYYAHLKSVTSTTSLAVSVNNTINLETLALALA
jgi:hypothetical protein